MFKIVQNIQLSVQFIMALLVIVMMGLLVTEIFKKNDKKRILVIIFIYILFLIRIGLDFYTVCFTKTVNWIFYSNIVIIGLCLLFFYINRKKIDPLLFGLFSICSIVSIVISVWMQLVSGITPACYLYMILLAFYNILFYLLVLSFLINSRKHD